MKNVAALLLSLLLVTNSLAQSTLTESNSLTQSTSALYSSLRESPLDLSYLLEVDMNKNTDNNYDGLSTIHLPTLSYDFGDYGRVSMVNYFHTKNSISTDEKNANDNYNRWERLTFKYSKNLLSQDQHGVSLSLAIERRNYMDFDLRKSINQYGLNRISASLNRSFENGLSVGNTLYFAEKDLRDASNITSAQNYIYLVTTQSYALTEKLSLKALQEWFHGLNKNVGNIVGEPGSFSSIHNTSDLSLTLGLSYQLSKRVSVGVEAVQSLMTSNNGRLFNQDIGKKANYDVYLSASLF